MCLTFKLDLITSPFKDVRVQKYGLKQIVGSDKFKWEEGLTPPIEFLPAKMTVELVARFLGFSPDAIPVLVKAKLLQTLGDPNQNAQKFFAKPYIVKLSEDVEWLDKATQAVYDYWNKKNEHKTVNLAPVLAAA